MGSFEALVSVVMILLAALALASCAAAVEPDAAKLRNPKLFFVSPTTTTLSTTTLCYSSSTAAAACGRKRRSVLIDSASRTDAEFDLGGVTKLNGDVESSNDDVSEIEAGQTSEREGKFLLYWMTTTSTSTTYTATTTISALACTPSGFVISNCAG